jgi:luciferase family oxidoreductase group 1
MKKTNPQIPISILDLATIVQGDLSPADAFARSRTMAQHAEQLGYNRYWFAEHHNMESVASAATAVLVGHIAGATKTIRVGSGGIMLPNHAPLVIAEQFGTLAALYPRRIDLGIGRAPGTDPLTSHALRRSLQADVNEFPRDVIELISYLGPKPADAKVQAIPGVGTNVPVWLLGSSTFSAQLAAMLGLPFAFAAHFAPTHLDAALKAYREGFTPSRFLDKPYAMVCVNGVAADTDAEAQQLVTSLYQLALGLFRNDRRPLPPPVPTMEGIWSPAEEAGVKQMMEYSFVGSPETIQQSLGSFLERTAADEVMIATHMHSLPARLRSMEIFMTISKLAN